MKFVFEDERQDIISSLFQKAYPCIHVKDLARLAISMRENAEVSRGLEKSLEKVPAVGFI